MRQRLCVRANSRLTASVVETMVIVPFRSRKACSDARSPAASVRTVPASGMKAAPSSYIETRLSRSPELKYFAHCSIRFGPDVGIIVPSSSVVMCRPVRPSLREVSAGHVHVEELELHVVGVAEDERGVGHRVRGVGDAG